VKLKVDAVVLKVPLHLLAIDIVDVDICYGETSLPALVAVGNVWVVEIKDTIDEGKIVFDLFVSLNMEAGVTGQGCCRLDCGFEIRHFSILLLKALEEPNEMNTPRI
jgi:hypothetical protein